MPGAASLAEGRRRASQTARDRLIQGASRKVEEGDAIDRIPCVQDVPKSVGSSDLAIQIGLPSIDALSDLGRVVVRS
jgi:hypothetical protein